MSEEPNVLDLKNPEVWIPFISRPSKINFSLKVKYLECGGYHTMLITDDNQIFGCGLNDRGQLGIPA